MIIYLFFRYEVYGKDILIANKMESNGIEGRIVVSETTKNLLHNKTKLKFETYKEVDILGSTIQSYLVSHDQK